MNCSQCQALCPHAVSTFAPGASGEAGGPCPCPFPPRPPSHGPALASTFRHVVGTSHTQRVAAGTRCAAELAFHVLVGPRHTQHTLALFAAEVGARPAGHCRGRVERLLGDSGSGLGAPLEARRGTAGPSPIPEEQGTGCGWPWCPFHSAPRAPVAPALSPRHVLSSTPRDLSQTVSWVFSLTPQATAPETKLPVSFPCCGEDLAPRTGSVEPWSCTWMARGPGQGLKGQCRERREEDSPAMGCAEPPGKR